jgi:hypothetical protein
MNSRRTQRTITTLLAVATIAAAPTTARALPAPDEHAGRHPLKLRSNAQLEQQERLGPKYVTVDYSSPSRTDPPAAIGDPSGFDWLDPKIGAGIAALALGLVAAERVLRNRRERERIQQERKDLANA